MLKNASLEAVEELICCGDIVDVELPLEKWISCSERLPEADDPFEVLCCDIHGNQLITHPFSSEEANTGYCAESEECYLYDCVAWMPLPEPYTEDADEK